MQDERYVDNESGVLKKYGTECGYRRRKILIVDDDDISCAILCHILEDSCDTLVADNGEKALDIMKKQCRGISAILLDLMMPVMDGYEFLNTIMKAPQFSSIPVIVVTSGNCEEDEIRCFESGAADFISKPYHSEIVKKRVERIMHLQETSAVLRMVQYDQLTGLYSKEYFYLETERILENLPDLQYDMVVADVDNFIVINELLGEEIKDEMLCYMADRYRKLLGDNGICTRLHDDMFAMLVEHGDSSWKEQLLWQWDEKTGKMPTHNLVIKYGVYENVDRKIRPFEMCDRAIMALNRIRNLYGRYVTIYDDSFRADLLREQHILDTMEQALEEHQFQVYFQPQYDINNDHISGAEALVRWIHPEFGFMSPGEFIPLFEKNGFITKLDFYIWEETCRCLREWDDEGRQPISVSINISRIDFSVSDLAERIIFLADSYGIDRERLHLEITESVYTDESDYIIQTVNVLRENGFKIEIDDFGSGYSSLNMLSELSIDALKLDLKFIQKNSGSHRSILNFIISLAKWMNLVTIAEGVETGEQVEKLKNLGCDYIQGYYYAKPMPREDFEHYLEEDMKRERHPKRENPAVDLPEDMDDGREKNSLLVVEDNEMNREILKFMLSPYYHVVETRNGKEAYDYLMAHTGEISCILLDMMMPVMDGFQFMKKRNQEKELTGIPVIIMSESEEDSDLMALRLGAECFVGKPYRREFLLLSIRNAIERWDWKNH